MSTSTYAFHQGVGEVVQRSSRSGHHHELDLPRVGDRVERGKQGDFQYASTASGWIP